MNAKERREAILARLKGETGPVSATALAKEHGVSRQIVVGDIALLRAGGAPISATPRGYVLDRDQEGLLHTVAVRHPDRDMERELLICVDNGCTVLDVVVEHPVYGQLVGQAPGGLPLRCGAVSDRSAPAAPDPCRSSPTASTCTGSGAPARRPTGGYAVSWMRRGSC